MDNNEYADKLLKVIIEKPNPNVARRIEDKIVEITDFLSRNDQTIDPSIIRTVAQISEVGYSMRTLINSPLVTTINTNYEFSIIPYNEKTPYPYNLICIRHSDIDIVYIFDIELFAGAHIDGIPVDK